MANVNFQYRSKKPTANIEVRLTFKDNDKYKSYYTRTNIEVSNLFWNEYKSNTRFRDVEKSNLKTEIENHLSKIETFITDQYAKETNAITKDWLKDTISNFYNPPKEETIISDDLLQYFDYFLFNKKTKVRPGTLRKLKVVRNKLEKFQIDTNHKYKVKDVNKFFLDDFINWCKSMNYDNSVINSNWKDIKSVCIDAHSSDIEISTDLLLLKTGIKNDPIDRVYLSVKELDKINELNNLPEYLDNAKDWLIISCFTGQRISDFMRFNSNMVRKEANRYFIDIRQQKTDTDVTIPLLPLVKNILDKGTVIFHEL